MKWNSLDIHTCVGVLSTPPRVSLVCSSPSVVYEMFTGSATIDPR